MFKKIKDVKLALELRGIQKACNFSKEQMVSVKKQVLKNRDQKVSP